MITKYLSRNFNPLLTNLLKGFTCFLPFLQAINYRKSPIPFHNIQFIFLQQVELSVFLKQKQADLLAFWCHTNKISNNIVGTRPERGIIFYMQ